MRKEIPELVLSVPLIKSLYCFKGYDNGRRFLVISLACYFLLLMLSAVLAKAPVLLVLLLLVCVPILAATSLRRIHDAGFATPLAVIPPLVFCLTALAMAKGNDGVSIALLVLALLVTLAMTTVSNAKQKSKRKYDLGYYGPIELHPEARVQVQRRYYDRIEPTIAPSGSDSSAAGSKAGDGVQPQMSLSVDDSAAEFQTERRQFDRRQSDHTGWEEELGKWLVDNKKLSIAGASFIALVILVYSIWNWTSEPAEQEVVEEKKPVQSETRSRLNKVSMPDNFWIMHDENDALTIAWQGDRMDDGSIWNALTGVGDRDCIEIRFNGGPAMRSMQVQVKNQGDYYADFSPVDSEELVKAIALKSRFNLCGFEFSLKGTQAKLMVNRKYADYFE